MKGMNTFLIATINNPEAIIDSKLLCKEFTNYIDLLY
jgi:hypothetical protein